MIQILPILPKATAIWLIENTCLTFKQIAEFCGMHELEIKAMADGDVAIGIKGNDPIALNQLTEEEIARCSVDPNAKLSLAMNATQKLIRRKKKTIAKYTPLARRHEKPDAIYWLLKNHPEIPDSKIVKLIGTTKITIASIRNRVHWNIKALQPRDPVLLGLCSQIEMNNLIEEVMLATQKKHDRDIVENKSKNI
jgi:hypothetical protein